MKKILSIFLLLTVAVSMSVTAQSYKRMFQGVGADTIIASETLTSVVNVSSNDFQTVAIQVAIDEVSGSTEGTATLWQSIDGTNYESTAATTWSTGVDTVFTLTGASFKGIYAKLTVTATATTQKNNVTATLKSWNQ